MELKDYQFSVIQDLDTYLDVLLKTEDMGIAFKNYWQDKGVLNQKYKNNVRGVPHVCIKVPTAGGKTFIAVNAVSTIFQAFTQNQPLHAKLVVWLVPSLTILDQTVKHLSDHDHPYRQKLNALFNGRVEVYEKSDLLQGAGFNADTVRSQLSIVVMTFDSLRGRSKEVLKVYQDNGYLASFLREDRDEDTILADYDATALINVIRSLKPLVVVDESHNAETALSVEMLENLNPHFIFDLTATPRNNSNIISYVDAMQLKRQNMVKLPVVVANQRTQEDVIMAAIKMRFQLEAYAKKEEVEGGKYIRPIVLFQAEPKGKEDNTTFEKIKEILLNLNIPDEEIKIKTANINELKDIDLSDKNCPVRYIITINALKEGWDCPFAYILATLANKSSIVDVTQILGRILRMPHVRKHKYEYLNMSYVFTSSSQFHLTLQSVVSGLNKAGFSERDYRVVEIDAQDQVMPKEEPSTIPLNLVIVEEADININELNSSWAKDAEKELIGDPIFNNQLLNSQDNPIQAKSELEAIKAQAIEQNYAYELEATNYTHNDCPPELETDMNTQKMMPMWIESATKIVLPQFFQKVETGGFFAEGDDWQKLEKDNLLTEFELAKKDIDFSFDTIDYEMAKVDVSDVGDDDIRASFTKLSKKQKEQINTIIRKQSNSGQVKSIVNNLFTLIGKSTFYPIADQDIKAYLTRIVETFTPEQRDDCLDNDWRYVNKIKIKVKELANKHASQAFDNWIMTQKICLRQSFIFPSSITPKENAPSISKSLYMHEGKINGFEIIVIQKIACLDNILWWHRNLERTKGFAINGFINHYPDFIILTKNNNLLLVETKGDDRDNSDSKMKLELGKKWESQAKLLHIETGLNYHYVMIFENKFMDGAHKLGDVIKLIEQL